MGPIGWQVVFLHGHGSHISSNPLGLMAINLSVMYDVIMLSLPPKLSFNVKYYKYLQHEQLHNIGHVNASKSLDWMST